MMYLLKKDFTAQTICWADFNFKSAFQTLIHSLYTEMSLYLSEFITSNINS